MTATLAPTTDADIADFLRYIEAARNCSPHTVVAYRHDLAVFAAFLDAKYPAGWTWETPDRLAFRSFFGDLQRLGRSKRTVCRSLGALRGFYRFLRNHLDRETANIPKLTRTPKLDSLLPKHFTIEQMQELFRLAEDDARTATGWRAHNQAIRDLAIAETFYSTGMRLSELCGLDFKDVELYDRVGDTRGWVRIRHGKGDKDRDVPLGSYAVQAVKAWLPVREAMFKRSGKRSPALFVSLRCDRIYQRTVQRRMEVLLDRVGCPELSVHAFRHSFATHMLDAGANIRAVQAMLGHASISMTGRYGHVAVTRLKETYMRCFPNANVDRGPYLDPQVRPDEQEPIP